MSAREIIRRDRQRREQQREERGGRRILRLPDVKAKTGKSKSAIYEGVEAGSFPKPVPLGGRAIGWLESEIDAWIDQRVAERDERIEAA